MKSPFPKFSSNWIAIGLLVGAFIYSAFRFYATTQEIAQGADSEQGQKIIRVTHWQLEPGFREALDWVIGEYNALPHIQEARVKIVQAPIPQRIYSQFMNVHLISGTASDIAVKGGTTLIKGNAMAKFYAPLGSYVSEPNPYNAPEYLSPELSPELLETLSTSPWKDTFFDGLLGGYDDSLSDYYGIPICATGGIRLFYNLQILQDVKQFAATEAASESTPEWLLPLWRNADNPDGYLSKQSGLDWLQNERIPQTLGQFMLYCHAVEQYAHATDNEHLVALSGSKYPHNDISAGYKPNFLSTFWKPIAPESDNIITAMEMLAAYSSGVWSFQSPEFQEFFSLSKDIASFYPKGYLGLDREQAQRRFVLGMAAVIRSGGWDASSILAGVAKRDDPKERFEVQIAAQPLAAAGERWHEFVSTHISEAGMRGSAPFAINKQSPHFDWALDFLKFASSHRINQEFSQRAGWLPVALGAEAPDAIAAFAPITTGFPRSLVMNFAADSQSQMPSSIRSAWKGQLNLFLTGDISREAMIESIKATLENPNIGMRKAWINGRQKLIDSSKASNQSLTLSRLEAILGSDSAALRERSTLSLNLIQDEGVQVEKLWKETYPHKDFPEN